jgi:DNA-binding MarR family transcriptional regulator
MGKKVTKSEYEALATFRYVLRQFLRFSEDAASAIGLTPQQHQVLLAIKGYPDRDRILIGELAERLQIRHHSVVGLVDRLVTLGLVTREQGTGDRRQVFVALTDVGGDLLEQLATAHRGELRRIGPQLIEQVEQLVDTMAPTANGKARPAAARKPSRGGKTAAVKKKR